MKKLITFNAFGREVKCRVNFELYAENHRLAISFFDVENGEPWDMVTVNLMGVKDYEVAVKPNHTYSMVLTEAGYTKKFPVNILRSGYNTYEVYELTQAAKKVYEELKEANHVYKKCNRYKRS